MVLLDSDAVDDLPRPCFACKYCKQPFGRENLTPAERHAIIHRTGLLIEWYRGFPMLAALLIKRRQLIEQDGVSTWFDVDQPVFACPWSGRRRARSPFIRHDFARFTPVGRTLTAPDLGEFTAARHADNNCGDRSLSGYWLQFLDAPDLPRWKINPRTGALDRIVAKSVIGMPIMRHADREGASATR